MTVPGTNGTDLSPRHPRAGGDPAPLLGRKGLKPLDSRLRGNDKNLDAGLKSLPFVPGTLSFTTAC